MRIHPTPERLRCPAINYPTHHDGPNIEEAFTTYALTHASEIDTPWIYLPIHWQNLYFRNERRSRTRDYYPDPEAQEVVNNLDPNKTYFTLTQADEGTYERLPKNVKVFGAGGTGDYAIPLLTSALPYTERKRDILASFIGTMECAGPIDWPDGHAEHSSCNPDGRGAVVRRAMFKALDGKPGFLLRDSRYDSGPAYVQNYAETLCRSVFALCPRGYGKTSFRMYEAMQLGAIPIYISLEPNGHWLPFQGHKNEGDLIWGNWCRTPWLETVDNIPDLLSSIASRPNYLAAMQRRLKEVVDAYFNLDVAPMRVARLVERVSR